MTAPALFAALLLGAGTALLLGELPWFGRRSLPARLRPYAPPTTAGLTATRPASATGAVLGPLVRDLGDRLSRLGGRGPQLETRLLRAGSDLDPARFRLRQLTRGIAAGGAGAAAALALRPGPLASLVVVVGAPVLAVLADEQALDRRARARIRRIQLELPVVAEQLGVLTAAGYSLPAAITRIGQRGRGTVADDLADIGRRIRHGLDERQALLEWQNHLDLPSVRRLVAVLCLHRDTADLGRLISEEARAIRAESHRDVLESIERRAQLVWIPVTVATLVPGLVFLAVPFVAAIREVTGGP